MNVLFITNCLDGSGWSEAGIRHALALDNAGVNLSVLPLKLYEKSHFHDIPARIKDLLGRTIEPDIVVQHVLPHMAVKCEVPTVCFFASEASPIPPHWVRKLNIMDDVWVISEHSMAACVGLDSPIWVFNHPVSIPTESPPLTPRLASLTRWKIKSYFLFYTIGEFTTRKNFEGLIRAYYREFRHTESVRLVLKTGGVSEQELKDFIGTVKKNSRLYADESRYPEIMLITERLSADEMISLHQACDCFVSASYGEASCLPALDAMSMGKTPIVPKSSGFVDYLSNEEGWLIPTTEDAVFGALDVIEGLHTGRETWAAPSIPHLGRLMREAYEGLATRSLKAKAGREKARQHSIERVGKSMKGRLEDILAGRHAKTRKVARPHRRTHPLVEPTDI